MKQSIIRKIGVALTVTVFFIACNNQETRKTKTELTYTKLIIDSTLISCNNSGNGFIQFVNNKFFYVDKDYCTINELNQTKRQSTTYLGLRDTALKIKHIDGFIHYKDKYYVLSYKTIISTDEKFSIFKTNEVNFYSTQSRIKMELFPTPTNPAIYEPHFYSYCVFSANNNLYMSIDTEHTLFNAYSNHDYYKKGFALASIDANSLRIKKLIANRNGIYLAKRNLPFFNGIRGTGSGNTIFLSFEADSMIHITNTLTNTTSYIGKKPFSFNDNYPTYKSIEVAFDDNLYKSERKMYGHYGNLYYDEKTGYLLREYYSGKNRSNTYRNGFQIFDTQNNTCIAEHEIEGETKPFYFIDNTVYTYRIISEEKIMIYKIKITP